MISPIGSSSGKPAPLGRQGLTLIELILVMGLLATVLALGTPGLSRFLEGRGARGESRRLLVLTRYGQSQAISAGIPMELWLDTGKGAYGLRPVPGYGFESAKVVEYAVGDRLRLGLDPEDMDPDGRASILFRPDGFIDPGSPEYLRIEPDGEEPIVLIRAENRLRYEVRGDEETAAR